MTVYTYDNYKEEPEALTFDEMAVIHEKMEKDSTRTATHDSLIARLNALARYLEGTGNAAEWRDEIATEEVGYGRKRIGDFGCYLAFVSAVHAR